MCEDHDVLSLLEKGIKNGMAQVIAVGIDFGWVVGVVSRIGRLDFANGDLLSLLECLDERVEELDERQSPRADDNGEDHGRWGQE